MERLTGILKLTVAERPGVATFTQASNRVMVELDEPVTITAGQALCLAISF